MKSSTSRYLISLGLNKFAIGGVLFGASWDLASLSGNPVQSVAIASALAFLPAGFSRPLYSLFLRFGYRRVLAGSLSLSALSTFLFPWLIDAHRWVFYLFYFFLWVLIFLSEAFLEHWFMTFGSQTNRAGANRLSGMSMAITQVGMFTGPVVISLLKESSPLLGYEWLVAAFLLSAFVALDTSAHPKAAKKVVTTAPKVGAVGYSTIALATIWGALAVFKVIPLVGKETYDSLRSVAWMEIAMAVSAGLVGWLLHLNVVIRIDLKFSMANSAVQTERPNRPT